MLSLPSSFIAAGCLVLAGLVLFRKRRRPELFFAAGAFLLAVEQFFSGLVAGSVEAAAVRQLESVKVLAAALATVSWLAFSLTFGRVDYSRFLKRWKAVLIAGFAAPFALLFVPRGEFFVGLPIFQTEYSGWGLGLGSKGYAFYALLILLSTLIVANLERTLRAAVGRVRWQIKFGVLGLGGYFAVRIYTSSEALLYSYWSTRLDVINSWSLLIGLCLVSVSIYRSRKSSLDAYLSDTALRGSITILAVGGYLVGVGFLVKLLQVLGWGGELREVLIFAALVGAGVVLLSDKVQQDLKRVARRHFRRPSYDYRQIWTQFAEASASFDEKQITRGVSKLISKTLETLVVSVWLYDPTLKKFRFLASSGLSEKEGQATDIKRLFDLNGEGQIVTVSPQAGSEEAEIAEKSKVQYLVPLKSSEELTGVMALGERVRHRALTFEDRELLEVLAEQTAAVLMNIRLTQRLKETSEMEAFQNMSAFFLHDLKNLANRLSLTVQNLPKHYEKAEFREEAFGTIGRCVDKIRSLCGQLSMIREKMELVLVETDLYDEVAGALVELKKQVKSELVLDDRSSLPVKIDRSQFKKVLVNLVLNAEEAIREGRQGDRRQESGGKGKETGDKGKETGDRRQETGEIKLRTLEINGWAVLEVQDNGIGMSREFLEERLFHPFQTTKQHGMGIGLYQSKKIVEGHGGKIEVESEEGVGSRFRVLIAEQGDRRQETGDRSTGQGDRRQETEASPERAEENSPGEAKRTPGAFKQLIRKP